MPGQTASVSSGLALDQIMDQMKYKAIAGMCLAHLRAFIQQTNNQG